MEFNFNSYDTSKQSISYCEIDKCKTVIKYKQAIEKVREIAESQIKAEENNKYKTNGYIVAFDILQICDEVANENNA